MEYRVDYGDGDVRTYKGISEFDRNSVNLSTDAVLAVTFLDGDIELWTIECDGSGPKAEAIIELQRLFTDDIGFGPDSIQIYGRLDYEVNGKRKIAQMRF